MISFQWKEWSVWVEITRIRRTWLKGYALPDCVSDCQGCQRTRPRTTCTWPWRERSGSGPSSSTRWQTLSRTRNRRWTAQVIVRVSACGAWKKIEQYNTSSLFKHKTVSLSHLKRSWNRAKPALQSGWLHLLAVVTSSQRRHIKRETIKKT